MPLNEVEWESGTIETGDIELVLSFLRTYEPRAYRVEELRRVDDLPQLYASQHRLRSVTDAEVVAEHLVERYYRLLLEHLVYDDKVERRRVDGIPYYRAV